MQQTRSDARILKERGQLTDRSNQGVGVSASLDGARDARAIDPKTYVGFSKVPVLIQNCTSNVILPPTSYLKTLV